MSTYPNNVNNRKQRKMFEVSKRNIWRKICTNISFVECWIASRGKSSSWNGPQWTDGRLDPTISKNNNTEMKKPIELAITKNDEILCRFIWFFLCSKYGFPEEKQVTERKCSVQHWVSSGHMIMSHYHKWYSRGIFLHK